MGDDNYIARELARAATMATRDDLAKRFEDQFHRYRPAIFGEDDRIAGPALTRTECMEIAAALRFQKDASNAR